MSTWESCTFIMNPDFSNRYSKFLIAIILSGVVLLAACSVSPRYTRSSRQNRQSHSNRSVTQISGVRYSKGKPYSEVGYASYYANKFNGRRTASGKRFDNTKYTAAHRKLPFGTKLRVTNESNGKFVLVEVTDRGPFTRGREIDLSRKAFMDITSNKNSGSMKVKIEIAE